MKIETTFLRSRVARRIFVLFICCALVPIGALAILSFSQVEKQLKEISQRRLNHASKDVARIIGERLYSLEREMKEAASKLSRESNPALRAPAKGVSKLLKERFEGLTLIPDKGENTLLFGEIQNIPKLTLEQKQHIRSGGTCAWSEHSPDLKSHIFMSMLVDPGGSRRGILLGKIAPAYLWGSTDELPIPPMIELCILDQSNNVLFSSFSAPFSFPKEVALKMTQITPGQSEWVSGAKEYIASYRSILRQEEFLIPKWTVVVSESKSDLLAPVAHFKKIFPFVVLLSLWVVLFLSLVQIRKSLIPLDQLREATVRISARDFNSPVTIKSGDEFEELGASFNKMVSQLGKQFNTLTTLNEIDRAILSATETEKIVEVVLARIPDVFPCDNVSVTSLDYNDRIIGRTYVRHGKADKEEVVEGIDLSVKEIQELMSHPESLFVELDGSTPSYLAPMVRNGIRTFLILPIVLKKKLSGFITLGWSSQSKTHTQEDFTRARQLADQMGVALSNASLIRELNELNWGTLEALARAIDAKSHWTAGHSERVTKLGMKIGRLLGLTQEQMDVLHRAGLLHDIGKLGIPRHILDKEGKLTEEEEKAMREHVRMGVRILEPIAAYDEVVPIVLHHHEYFNGEGYPDGLAGKAISLGARIFAVADTFDALTSNRPYRRALNRKTAIEMIKQGRATQYDPDIVQAFLEVMAEERVEGEA